MNMVALWVEKVLAFIGKANLSVPKVPNITASAMDTAERQTGCDCELTAGTSGNYPTARLGTVAISLSIPSSACSRCSR